ncbi:MAG: sulfatase [Planctomycetota bacterium]
MQTRRQFIRNMGCFTVSCIGVASCASQGVALQAGLPEKKPNILFILSDDHAKNAISCYGSKLVQTPNIDRIAKEGILFDNCICTNSICAPSRAAILTGKHSHLNGQIKNNIQFNGSQQTFPKIMRQNGYQTALIGKWHLNSDPTGFDHWNILTNHYQQGTYFNPVMQADGGEPKKYKGYTTDLISDLSIEWLENRDKTKPFMLLCHHKAVHGPWLSDEKHAKMYEDVEMPEPETLLDDYAGREALTYAKRGGGQALIRHTPISRLAPKGLDDNEWTKWTYQTFIKRYCRAVSALDDNVGRMLDYLDKAGLAEDTIVVYSSDQGYFLGEHGLCDKRYMYEESIQMPLAIRYPKAVKPGFRNKQLTTNLDFAPTFLDYADIETPADIQGRSWKPLLKGKTPKDWRKAAYYHYQEFPPYQTRCHYGIRTERYKLIHFYHDIDSWELYDLEKDPTEMKNLYNDPACSDIRGTLAKELKALQVKVGDVGPFKGKRKPSGKQKQKKGNS